MCICMLKKKLETQESSVKVSRCQYSASVEHCRYIFHSLYSRTGPQMRKLETFTDFVGF